MTTDVESRLDYAEVLLAGDRAGDVRLRGAVWLIRIALERSIRQAWESRYPGYVVRGMRNQLLALPKITNEETVDLATELWHSLSRAGHHHHYELTPTVAEIRDWLRGTRTVAERLGSPRPTG